MRRDRIVRREGIRLRIDFKAYFPGLSNWSRLPIKLALAVAYPRFGVLYFHRMNKAFRLRDWKVAAYAFYLANYYLNHIDISPLCDIGSRSEFPHPLGIVIGGLSTIGKRTKVFSCVTLGMNSAKVDDGNYPSVGHDCYIGTGAKLIGGVRVGARSIVGANSVVLRDVPPDSVAAGVPASVLRSKA